MYSFCLPEKKPKNRGICTLLRGEERIYSEGFPTNTEIPESTSEPDGSPSSFFDWSNRIRKVQRHRGFGKRNSVSTVERSRGRLRS